MLVHLSCAFSAVDAKFHWLLWGMETPTKKVGVVESTTSAHLPKERLQIMRQTLREALPGKRLRYSKAIDVVQV